MKDFTGSIKNISKKEKTTLKHLGTEYTQASGVFFALIHREETAIFRMHSAVENTHQGLAKSIGSTPCVHSLTPAPTDDGQLRAIRIQGRRLNGLALNRPGENGSSVSPADLQHVLLQVTSLSLSSPTSHTGY